MTEHGLEIGDKILGERDTKINVYGEDKDFSMVDLDTGKRTDYAKGGKVGRWRNGRIPSLWCGAG